MLPFHRQEWFLVCAATSRQSGYGPAYRLDGPRLMVADPIPAPADITADARWLGLLGGEQLRLNLSEEFATLAGQCPEMPLSILALHRGPSTKHEYETLTYGYCRVLMDRYARLLYDDGLRCGDTALILLKPTLDFFPVLLALLKLGLIPVALEPGLPRDEKLAAIERIAPRVLVAAPGARMLRALRARSFSSIRHVVTVGASLLPAGTTLAASRPSYNSAPTPTARTTTRDPMFIGFTTGSTGPAKGVVFTQANGAAIIQGMRDALDLRRGDVCLSCHPAFSLYFAGAGATVVTPDLDPRYPQSADPACLLAVIRDRRPVAAFIQLPILHALLRHCAARGETIPYLTKILTTGATVPLDLVEGLHMVLAEPEGDLHVMYGATEALCVSFTTGRDILRRTDAVRAGSGTYLGKPSPFVRVGIIPVTAAPIDRWDAALSLAPGLIGEICVQGPTVTPAYYRNLQDTRDAKIGDSGGVWHRMGDAGYVDAEGGLWYCGRLSSAVQTTAGPLYSDLVEPLFNNHPAVHRSALIGVARAETRAMSPAVLVEPRSGATLGVADVARLRGELQSLARAHPHTQSIDDIRIYRGTFPVDVRHGAKIRRDLLTAAEATAPEYACERFPATQHIAFRGYRIAYYEHGAGESILFLHNAGNDHHIWEHQIERLGQEFRMIAADSLGYGRSDHPRVEYTLQLYTEMVSALVDQLNLAPVTIIGSCTGASMALNYALQHPERVKRLILFHVATPHTVRGGGFETITRLVERRPLLTQALVPAVRTLMTHGLLHRGMINSQYGRHAADDPSFRQHLHRLYSQPHQAASMLGLFAHWDSFAPLDTVSYPSTFPPLHLLWGEENRLLPIEQGRALSNRLNAGAFDAIAGGGHLVMRERSEVVTRRILELLR